MRKHFHTRLCLVAEVFSANMRGASPNLHLNMNIQFDSLSMESVRERWTQMIRYNYYIINIIIFGEFPFPKKYSRSSQDTWTYIFWKYDIQVRKLPDLPKNIVWRVAAVDLSSIYRRLLIWIVLGNNDKRWC